MVCKGGLAAEYDEPELKKKLDEKEIRIRIVNKKRAKAKPGASLATSLKATFKSMAATVHRSLGLLFALMLLLPGSARRRLGRHSSSGGRGGDCALQRRPGHGDVFGQQKVSRLRHAEQRF